MKKLLLLLLLILIGCSEREPKPLDYGLLEERDGVHYRTNTNEIYSGPVFNIDGESEGTLKEGKWNGTVKKYYFKDNYEEYLKEESNYKDGEKDGLWKTYDHTGKLSDQKTYKNGIPHGTFKSYYKKDLWGRPETTIEKESTYKDGELDGPYKYYELPERLVEEGNYKDGKKDGLWKMYDDPFFKDRLNEGTYKDGKKDGLWKMYEYDGTLKEEITYKNDIKNGPHKFYQMDGKTKKQLIKIQNFKDGKSDGPRKYYYDGQLINGFHKSYDKNGKIDSEGIYKNGLREGFFYIFHGSSGRSTITYKDGLREGVFKSYDNDLQLESEYTWKNGKRNGPYRYYYKYGQLRQEGQYKDGEPYGTFTSYTKGGQISKVETLKDGKLIESSGGNDEYEGPCDLDTFKSVVMTNNKIIYGDRLYDVEVDSPNEGGYFDYRVIVWKRTGGLEYKFFRSNCSEI